MAYMHRLQYWAAINKTLTAALCLGKMRHSLEDGILNISLEMRRCS